jgi:hypothetical protein
MPTSATGSCWSPTQLDTTTSHTFELVAGDTRLTSNSWGSSGDEIWGMFEATPTEARRLAASLQVPVHDRAPWLGQLEGRFEPRGKVTAGATTAPVTFTLTNTGPCAVWLLDGGRQRNQLGRDNRFTFTIVRGGERLELRRVEDFGGLGTYRRLQPGASHAFAVDLAHWATFDRAATYTIEASYEAALMPADFEPSKELPPGWHSHLQRTRTVRACLDLVVD